MKYLLTFVRDETQMFQGSDEEMKAALEAWSAFDKSAVDAGVLIACEPLEHPREATTIHVGKEGDRAVTDGPFAETKEQLGGFALLECADLDEAMEWAAKVPLAPDSIMEVRKVRDLSPYGYESSTVRPAKARATA
jgi:hypothetical protein